MQENPEPSPYSPPMEVHHHAHHEAKRNWRSYFWEFLMLFLAYRIHQLKGSNVVLSTRLALLRERAIRTMEFLQKEYHLD